MNDNNSSGGHNFTFFNLYQPLHAKKKYVEQYKKDLEPGDILIFKISQKKKSISQKIIKYTQQFALKGDEGSNTDVHVAICTENFDNDDPKIAHVISGGGREEPLHCYVSRVNEKSCFDVYRPQSSAFATELAKKAAEKAPYINNYQIEPITMILNNKYTNNKCTNNKYAKMPSLKDSIAKSSCCSKFVAQIINATAALNKKNNAYSLGQTILSPKQLSHVLSQQENLYTKYSCDPQASSGQHGLKQTTFLVNRNSVNSQKINSHQYKDTKPPVNNSACSSNIKNKKIDPTKKTSSTEKTTSSGLCSWMRSGGISSNFNDVYQSTNYGSSHR